MTPPQLRAELDRLAEQLDRLADQLDPGQQGAVRHLAQLAHDVGIDLAHGTSGAPRMGTVQELAPLLARLPPDAPLLLRRADGYFDLGRARVESAGAVGPAAGWVTMPTSMGRPVLVVE